MSREIIFILARTENQFQYKLCGFYRYIFYFSTEILPQVPLYDIFVSHQQMLFIQNMSIYFI